MGEQMLALFFLFAILLWGLLTTGVAVFGLYLVHLAARDPQRRSVQGMNSTPYTAQGKTR